ncbi:CpaF family protein [Pseudomonas sp. GX19020]|uniref:CpaF family protein n=1 Tax=Pseudomonadota TaxID=1224 RepID=UPI00089ACA26|nr:MULTISPECIES: CpaF family protein [Pseudomonadota]MCL4067145.1 CpaF family protein [Pseudomonas sp. GX19020]SED30598.1 pilus assembly protein CpaF [Rhodobacter sp. 24-YEA-8]
MFRKFRDSRLAEQNEVPQENPLSHFQPEAALPAEVPSAENQAARQRRRKLTEIRQQAHQQLLEVLNLSALVQASEADIKAEIAAVLKAVIPSQSVAVSRSDRDSLVNDLYYEVMGLGPLEILLNEESVSDILINGPEQVFIEQGGLLELTDVQFQDEAHLRRILQKIVGMVGRRLDESTPYVDARLQDGSRLNAVIYPIALDGTLVSIRKFRKDKLSLEQLTFLGAMSEKMAIYLRAAVACRLNIVISGGTGSGKTTLMNALSAYIGKRERIITVEDTAELQLQQKHVGRMESRPPNIEGKGAVTQRDCLRNALRMRPDRIIVGETRGDEVIDMLQAMNTGHDGSMTTIHANSARDATSRLENMVAMAGIEIPLAALRRQVASAVNLIVQVNRLQDGSRKVTSITEVTGCEGDVLTMQELFYFEHSGVTPDGRVEGHFAATGVRSDSSDRFRRWGITLPPDLYGA